VNDAAIHGAAPGDLARYQVICLLAVARPSPDLWDKLLAYVGQGGGLAIVPGGSELDWHAYGTEKALRLVPGRLIKEVRAPTPAGLTWNEESYRHPVMAPFGEWKRGGSIDFQKPGLRPATFRYWQVEADPKTVVVSYTDSVKHPALLESMLDRRSLRGRVMLFTTALDDNHISTERTRGARWNDYLKNSFYFVLVNKTIGYLAGDAEEKIYSYQSGQSVPVMLPASPGTAVYSLAGPGINGASGVIQRTENQNPLQISQAVLPGNYQLFGRDGQVVTRFSMNVPPEESQLAQVPSEQIEALFGPDSVVPLDRKMSLPQALESHWSQPVELLPWLMILVLLMLAVENLLANKFYRKADDTAN
jgi:hypothetical protein